MYGEQIFLRGLLDRLGVVPDYFTCGDYKSAGEMFMRTEPSEEAAEMTKWLYDRICSRREGSILSEHPVSLGVTLLTAWNGKNLAIGPQVIEFNVFPDGHPRICVKAVDVLTGHILSLCIDVISQRHKRGVTLSQFSAPQNWRTVFRPAVNDICFIRMAVKIRTPDERPAPFL